VAVAGAQVAVLQTLPGIGRTCPEFARLGEIEISGLHNNL